MRIHGRKLDLDGWDGKAAAIRSRRTDECRELRRRVGDRGGVPFGLKEYAPRTDGVANTLTTVEKELMIIENMENKGKRHIYRIRKFTPRECFRLMGVSEADIDRIQASGVSKSQQYKMAGNSIVVDVLYHIFKNLFTEQERTTLF